jgi:hypothetical protein
MRKGLVSQFRTPPVTLFFFFFVKKPFVDGHMKLDQEFFEVVPVDAVMPAGKSEGFETAALDPFQHSAFTDLAVSGDVFGSKPDIVFIFISRQSTLLCHFTFVLACVFTVFLA